MRFAIIILSILIFTACFSGKKSDNITNGPDENIPAYLDSIIPFMTDFEKGNDSIYDISYHENGYFLHMVGKIIDGTNIYALIYDERDTLLNFFHFDIAKAKWKQIGSERPVWDQIYDLSVEDLDGNNRNEVVTFSYPNMNGNTFKEIYYFSPSNDSVHIANSFFTSTYEADIKNKTVRTDYGGSWYMPLRKTVYKWYGEYLMIVKEMVLELKEDTPMGSDDYILSYYENTTLKTKPIIDSLTLIYTMPYIEKKHQHLWDGFFENSDVISDSVKINS